jgi:hypothetical protein
MSTPALALCGAALPATPPEYRDLLIQARELIKTCPQVELPTEHFLHAGMYARTVRMPAGTVLGGALIKVRTMVIVNGHAKIFVADGVAEIEGFNVYPASANRMQMFARDLGCRDHHAVPHAGEDCCRGRAGIHR